MGSMRDANQTTRDYMDRILIEERLIGAKVPSLEKGGAQGVKDQIEKMNRELAMILGFTGCNTPADAEPSMLWDGLTGKPLA